MLRPVTVGKPAMSRDVDLEEVTRAVAAALRNVERELEVFILKLTHGDPLISLDAPFASRRPVETVCDAYARIDYGMEDDVRSSVTCVGVVCASQSAMGQALRLNAAKAQLQATCAPLQKYRMRVRVRAPDGQEVVRMSTLVREVLRRIGRSHLNMVAAYRRVPVLGALPSRIAFTRTLTRRVRRATREALLERLALSDKPLAADDRARLLSTRDPEFAVVDPHAPNVRANIWYRSRDARNRDCVQVSAEVPILFGEGRRRELPEIVYPDAEEWARTADGPRRPRATKLEAQPFLRTLPVFRYRASPSLR
jgi:hypothetical protein